MRSLVVLVALLAGCAPEGALSEATLGSAELRIVNGSYDPGDPAVVALTNGEHITCSAALIAPHVVLTAAHCVPPHSPYHASFSDIEVFFGSVFPSGTSVAVSDGWAHSGWSPGVLEDDIALLRLATPSPHLPVPFESSAITRSDIDAEVRIIGFGATDAKDPFSVGVKHEGTTRISEIQPAYFVTAPSPSMVCGGDSGGPAFLTRDGGEVLVGVHSRTDQDCDEGSIETRVQAYLDVIHSFIGSDPPATCDADGGCGSGCATPDPDCPCESDGHCTDACPDATLDADCNCRADGSCNATCPSDPDCSAACRDNGLCEPSCPDDPDCATDGICVPEIPDADCPTAEPDEEDIVVGGCAAGGSRALDGWWLLAAVGLWRARRRRFTPRAGGGA